jgi:filamentous hemagglutinin family protein
MKTYRRALSQVASRRRAASNALLMKSTLLFVLCFGVGVVAPGTGSAQVSAVSKIEGGTTNGIPTNVIQTTVNGKIAHSIQGGANGCAECFQSYNLFHTFTNFQLRGAEVALFRDGVNTQGQTLINNAVQNVVARVGNPTFIDGLVDTKTGYPNAHFYLLSPNGISLGTNARFNVQNYVYLTTANFIKFTDGNVFSAAATGNQPLSIAPVASFGFTGATNATIGFDKKATLMIDPFTTVAFLGAGQIILGDNLTVKAATDNARFEFATVAQGEIGVKEAVPRNTMSALGYDLQSNSGFGDRNSIIVGHDVTIDPGPNGILRLGDSGPPGRTGPPGFITPGETVYNTSTTAFGWNFFQTSPATVSLTPSPNPVEAGNGGTVAVSLNGTTANPMVVGLSSDNSKIASLPPSVDIAPGETSKAANFTTAQDGAAGIKATSGNAQAIATIQVNPVPVVSVSPLSVLKDATGTVTVTLSKVAPADTTVQLKNSNPSVIKAQTSIVVNGGSQTQSFQVQGLETGTSTVTAQSGSSTISNIVQVTGEPSTPKVLPDSNNTLLNTFATGQIPEHNEPTNNASGKVGTGFFYTNQLALNMDRCSAGKDGEFSSFVQRGRDRIPFQPGQFLSSPSETADGDHTDLGGLPVRPAPLVYGHARILNLAPKIASFLQVNAGC